MRRTKWYQKLYIAHIVAFVAGLLFLFFGIIAGVNGLEDLEAVLILLGLLLQAFVLISRVILTITKKFFSIGTWNEGSRVWWD